MRYVENENNIILVVVVFILIFNYKCNPVVLMILNFNKVSLVLYIIQYLALQGVHDIFSMKHFVICCYRFFSHNNTFFNLYLNEDCVTVKRKLLC